MELVTIWDGSVHASHRGLLDDIRGITGRWSAIHEPRPPSAPPPVVRYVPKNPRGHSFTARIAETLAEAGTNGLSKRELLAAFHMHGRSDAVTNALSRLHRHGRIKMYLHRKHTWNNRYWTTEYAPKGTQ